MHEVVQAICSIIPFYTPPDASTPNREVNYREYVEVQLISPLVKGECYDFEMYVSLNDRSFYSIANIGVHFSLGQVLDPLTEKDLKLIPQITNLSGILTDTLNWVSVSGNFIASGGEDHITIGNFKNDTTTNYQLNSWTVPGWKSLPYYYIEDVSLYPNLPPLALGNDTTLCQGQTLTLDAVILNATYLWQDNSTNPTFNVSQAGKYWVQITGNCGMKSDTINISFVNINHWFRQRYNPMSRINFNT